jgi:flagellar motor protein MotB
VGRALTPVLLLVFGACLPSPEGVSAQLDAEVRAARQRLATIDADGCEHAETPHPIYPQLVQVFTGTEVEVMRDGLGARLVIPADLLFTADGVVVRREATMVVDLLGTAIGLHGDLHVEVRGHSDATGVGDPMGRSLSMSRALMDALVAAHGLERVRFTVAGRGAGAPRSPGDTPADHARNRRVEVWLQPSG